MARVSAWVFFSCGNFMADCSLSAMSVLSTHTFNIDPKFCTFLFCRVSACGRRLCPGDGVCRDQGQPSWPPLHRPVRRLLLQRPDGGRGPVLVDAIRRLHRIHQDNGLFQTKAVEANAASTTFGWKILRFAHTKTASSVFCSFDKSFCESGHLGQPSHSGSV